MRTRALISAIAVLSFGSLCLAQQTNAAGTGEGTGVELLERLYKPLCVPGDDLSWPMKVYIATSAESSGEPGAELKFSTSTREIFFTWAKGACADWLDDLGSYVTCHGDVHFGNVGSYVVDIPSIRLSLGLKDFDEAAYMPFQTDLLQAMVTLRLQARADGFELTEPQSERAARILLSAYRQAMSTGRNATDLLLPDPKLSKLVDQNSKSLRDEVDDVIQGGEFRKEIRSKKGALKDLYRPVLKNDTEKGLFTKGELAMALANAFDASPKLQKLTVKRTADAWFNAIEAVAMRTRIGSGGSQGMLKIMIHARAAVPLAGSTTDAIIYLKQAATSAAERSGYVPAKESHGGRRVWLGGLTMTSPEIDGTGWCDLGGRTFLVDIRNPWEDEPEVSIKDEEELEWAARLLGTCLGAAHTTAMGGVEQADVLLRRVNRKLEEQLISRSEAFTKHNAASLKAWFADEKVAELRKTARTQLGQ